MSRLGACFPMTNGQFRQLRGVLPAAVLCLLVAGCGVFQPDAVPETDEEWWADYEKRVDNPGIQIYPLSGRARGDDEAPRRVSVDDPEYQEYLDWKEWQDFKQYQEWKRAQGQPDAAAPDAPATQ